MLASSTFPSPVQAPYFSEAGIYIGEGQVMRVRSDRINRVLEKIVKGLYYRHCGELLQNVQFTSQHFDPYPGVAYPPYEVGWDLWGRAVRGQDAGEVFRYWYAIAQDDPRYSSWWLQFYKKPLFTIRTQPTIVLAAA
jgi:hypothetical protein